MGRLARNADPLSAGDAGDGHLNLARSASDTATDEVMPAGAAPLGSGDPHWLGLTWLQPPQVGFDMAPTQVAGSGLRPFTVLMESTASGGNALACIKVVLPAGYSIASAAVAEALVTSGRT